MTMRTVWTVYTTDSERGDAADLVGVFGSRESADLAAIGQGWYGGRGLIEDRQAVFVDALDDFFLLDKNNDGPIQIDVNLPEFKEKAKQAALAELTDADKKALGL